MKKIPIAPTLKGLNLYKTAIFPLDRYTSVNAAIQTLQTESGKKFTQRRKNELRQLEVTRTK